MQAERLVNTGPYMLLELIIFQLPTTSYKYPQKGTGDLLQQRKKPVEIHSADKCLVVMALVPLLACDSSLYHPRVSHMSCRHVVYTLGSTTVQDSIQSLAPKTRHRRGREEEAGRLRY